MTGRSTVLKNIAFNFVGLSTPLIVAFACIPKTMHALGVANFGLLSVAWVIIGYTSIFDLGLGRALTHSISQKVGLGRHGEISPLIRKTLLFMLALSVAGGFLIAAVSPWLSHVITSDRADLAGNARSMLVAVSLAIPAVVLSTGLRGILEAFERFGEAALVRSFTGIWTYLAPFLVVLVTDRLEYIVYALVVGRYAGLVAFLFALRREVFSGERGVVSGGVIVDLLRFGGWMTVSNTVSPLMTNMDRFFVSAIAGVSKVAYYTTPFDTVSRLFVVPEAVFGVLFPRMTKSITGDGLEAEKLYIFSMKALGALMFWVALVFIGGGHSLLLIWLGRDFANNSAVILSLLAIGTFINTLARPPYNLIQARGRSDITAKLHLIELPLYAMILFLTLRAFGVVGAAVAWLARITVDYVLLVVMARYRTSTLKHLLGEAGIPLLISAALLALAFIPSVKMRLGICAALLPLSFVCFWVAVLNVSERAVIEAAIRSLIPKKSLAHV